MGKTEDKYGFHLNTRTRCIFPKNYTCVICTVCSSCKLTFLNGPFALSVKLLNQWYAVEFEKKNVYKYFGNELNIACI